MHETANPDKTPPAARPRHADWRAVLAELGPGVITGAADDDPSGISTYTITGASYGYRLLWTSLVTLPMNFAVQSVCARIGLVTGHGLGGVIARHYGRRLLYPVVVLLFIANAVNIGADIGAIAAAVELLVHIPAITLVVPIGLGIALIEVIVPYARFARMLKVLTLVVFAYVLGAFIAAPDWGAALRGTLVPRLSFDDATIATVVAVLGTTISPYLFFWQTSEEVEEEQEQGLHDPAAAPDRVRALLRAMHVDVASGMALANAGFYFVVLTSAATLFASGQRDVETAQEAAEALRPLAGDAASLLFALGIIGTGLLAVPVLAGSVAYAAAELYDWPEGLNQTFRRAPQFYGVIALATLIGVAINFSGIPAIRALFLSAVVNGVISPVLLAVILVVANDRQLLGEFTSGPTINALTVLTLIAMTGAVVAMVWTWL